MKFRGRAEH